MAGATLAGLRARMITEFAAATLSRLHSALNDIAAYDACHRIPDTKARKLPEQLCWAEIYASEVVGPS